MNDPASIELEPGAGFRPRTDPRPHIPEPLPVRLVAVEDMRLPSSAGLERALDSFYVGILRFERDGDETIIRYRSDNFSLNFDVVERRVERDDLRSTGVEVPSLREIEHKLIAAEMEYTRQKGVEPGRECLILQDPAGNWIAVMEMKRL